MSIHSKFMIHWTGKDLNQYEGDIQKQYVARLKDICRKGLYMNPGTETIHGREGTSVTARISRVCFSEIRLSQVQEHAQRYGELGIGFHRDFVIEREGNPVLYVQNGDNGVLIENFCHLHQFTQSNKQALKELEIVLGYLKNMSDPNVSELKYYEEMEWRVVHLDRLEDIYISVEDRTKNIYRLKLKRDDIKIIVFPNKDTKKLALNDTFITFFFKDNWPIIATIDECESF